MLPSTNIFHPWCDCVLSRALHALHRVGKYIKIIHKLTSQSHTSLDHFHESPPHTHTHTHTPPAHTRTVEIATDLEIFWVTTNICNFMTTDNYTFNCPVRCYNIGYIHNPSYYHHQIESIHLSHCCHIFPWLCVWDGCTIIFGHLLHIYPGNTGTLFPLLMFSLWYLQMIGYIMACRSCSFVCRLHHLIIIIMQTYLKALNYKKCLSGIWCRVCV